jgi:phytoene dehydrogenase-like protein
LFKFIFQEGNRIMNQKVIIIGAGLSGLSAGIALQKAGINTEIFELAGWAGGVCTSWVRQGYRFDGCIHWMVGTHPDTDFYKLYREVDALAADTPIYSSDSIEMEIGGTMYTLPLHYPEFCDFLRKIAPEDQAGIAMLDRDLKKMVNSKLPAKGPANLSDLIRLMKESRGSLEVMGKTLSKTVEEYIRPIKNSTLRTILFNLMPANFSATALMMMLSARMTGNGGYPLGGSLEVIHRVEAKYRSLGGEIHFNSKVEKIVVKNGKATGIEVKGEFFPADAVIAAGDAYDTLVNLLGKQYHHPQLEQMLKNSPLFEPLGVISFGLKQRFDIPYARTYEIPEGIEVAPGIVQHRLFLHGFDFDPSAAPEGGSSVMTMAGMPLTYWENLRESDMSEYKRQKQALAERFAQAIDKRIPGFAEAIVVTDVATPATYVRLVNLYQASYEGFLPTPAALRTSIKKSLPGLPNVILCGQWTTAGGGICTAVDSGMSAAALIQRKLK